MENPESKIESDNEEWKKYTEAWKKYTYRDNSTGGKVIFECVAKDILEADKMYQEKTGKDPEKQNYVGRSIEKIELGAEKQ